MAQARNHPFQKFTDSYRDFYDNYDAMLIERRIEREYTDMFRRRCIDLGVDPGVKWTRSQLEMMKSAFSRAFRAEPLSKIAELRNSRGKIVNLYIVWFQGITFPGVELADDAHESKSLKSMVQAWRMYFMYLFCLGATKDYFYREAGGEDSQCFYHKVVALEFSTPEEFAMKYGMISND